MAAQPTIASDSSYAFDGIGQYLKCTAFTLNQPETVYILGQQVSWTANDHICDGNTANSGAIAQTNTTPELSLNAGSATASNTGLAAGVYGVVVAVFNGASSILQVNNTTTATGNAGAGNMGGFTLGATANATQFGNIQVKEVIVFADAHDATTRGRVYSYLKKVGNLP